MTAQGDQTRTRLYVSTAKRVRAKQGRTTNSIL